MKLLILFGLSMLVAEAALRLPFQRGAAVAADGWSALATRLRAGRLNGRGMGRAARRLGAGLLRLAFCLALVPLVFVALAVCLRIADVALCEMGVVLALNIGVLWMAVRTRDA